MLFGNGKYLPERFTFATACDRLQQLIKKKGLLEHLTEHFSEKNRAVFEKNFNYFCERKYKNAYRLHRLSYSI